ncbi:OB-fold nucleic acid binding domain-containing protein [Actinoplanes utahensis]|uniref:OB domain-containing protein n=1 Tax=Actinoplanes utahensis TaxID=1869 RepID=A0A0A6X8Z1_ACTUT|nr:hypothetical protein MB27_16490 [Actinoplanes utahensis]
MGPGSASIAGRVHRRRLLKSVAFLIVRDAAGLSQVLVTHLATRARVERLTEESVVEVTAVVAANEQPPNGVELISPEIREEATAFPRDLNRNTP